MDEREYFGPSRIALKPEQLTKSDDNNNKKLDLSAFVKKTGKIKHNVLLQIWQIKLRLRK